MQPSHHTSLIVEPDETLLQQMDALEGHQHPDTPSGAPPAVEAYWAEQGQRVVRYTRHGTAWIAWRWLVAMAVSGWHFIPDLVALEQGGAGYQWSNRYRRAYRRLRDTGCIEIYILALGRYRQVRLIRLSSSAQKLLGGEGIKVVQSDWEIMSEDHDPRGDQSDHTAHTVLAARMARLYGYQVEILPAEQPYVDLRLQDPDGERCSTWSVRPARKAGPSAANASGNTKCTCRRSVRWWPKPRPPGMLWSRKLQPCTMTCWAQIWLRC